MINQRLNNLEKVLFISNNIPKVYFLGDTIKTTDNEDGTKTIWINEVPRPPKDIKCPTV